MPEHDRQEAPESSTADITRALMDAYKATPIVDDPRAESNKSRCQEVLEVFLAIWPHRDVTDDTVRLPIRLTTCAGAAMSLEIGPYDLTDTDVKILKAAIASWDRTEYGPIPETEPMKIQIRGKPTVPTDVSVEPKAQGQQGVGTHG